MGISVVSGPTTEPVTLTEVKDHLRVAITEDDGLIAGYIFAARTWAEGQIHRPICSRAFRYTADFKWPYNCYRPQIELPNPPLQAVTSVTYIAENGIEQTLATDQYTVLTDRPKGLIVPAYGVSWPSVRAIESAVRVSFIAGYTSFSYGSASVSGPGVPDDLRVALMLHCEIMLDRDPQMRESLEAARDTLISPYMVPSF